MRISDWSSDVCSSDLPQSPIELSTHITLSMNEDDSRQRWDLQDAKGQVQRVELQPRLSGHDFPLLKELAIAGMGIALLPETICADAVRANALEVVLPEWRLPQGLCHAVFPSRRGLLPAGRVFRSEGRGVG